MADLEIWSLADSKWRLRIYRLVNLHKKSMADFRAEKREEKNSLEQHLLRYNQSTSRVN
jgi:hypothetical protein